MPSRAVPDDAKGPPSRGGYQTRPSPAASGSPATSGHAVTSSRSSFRDGRGFDRLLVTLTLAFLLVFSAFVNAPLLTLANFNLTPNPSKAPWYFLGLQELLTMFHPMVAGVTIPGIGLFALILAAYTDRNPSNKPEDRKFAVSIFTLFLMFWAVLALLGSFFRGPGFLFVFPWVEGLFFEL